MIQNITKEFARETNIDWKDSAPLKKIKKLTSNLMQIKVANYAIDLLQDVKPNITLLNEILYTTATVISPVTITHKQSNFKPPKWKLKI